jgi:hypothetical protein
VDLDRADAQAGGSAQPILSANQGKEPGRLSPHRRVQGQQLQQHHLCRRDGTIAYLHPQFAPVRDDRFDYTKPVDGSDPRTDWQGLHRLDQLPFLRNPGTGWIQNTNNWPYSAAGRSVPGRRTFRATWTRSGKMRAAFMRRCC